MGIWTNGLEHPPKFYSYLPTNSYPLALLAIYLPLERKTQGRIPCSSRNWLGSFGQGVLRFLSLKPWSRGFGLVGSSPYRKGPGQSGISNGQG